MIGREIALEALGVLCNAKVTAVESEPGEAQLFSIHQFIPRVLEILRTGLSGDGIYSESSTPVLNTDVRCPGVCQGVSTDETTGEIKLELTIDQQQFFHPRHDYDFTNRKDTLTFWRGDEKYKRPCGYKRFGLKVLGKYKDNTWLGRRGRGTKSVAGEWPVSYHGTKAEHVDGIIKGTYKAGPRKRCGRGVYSTPHISVAERYAKTFTSKKDGKNYRVILQNRINPKYRVICEKEPKYWLIRIPSGTSEEEEKELVNSAIRPYGLLIKEVKETA